MSGPSGPHRSTLPWLALQLLTQERRGHSNALICRRADRMPRLTRTPSVPHLDTRDRRSARRAKAAGQIAVDVVPRGLRPPGLLTLRLLGVALFDAPPSRGHLGVDVVGVTVVLVPAIRALVIRLVTVGDLTFPEAFARVSTSLNGDWVRRSPSEATARVRLRTGQSGA